MGVDSLLCRQGGAGQKIFKVVILEPQARAHEEGRPALIADKIIETGRKIKVFEEREVYTGLQMAPGIGIKVKGFEG